MKRVCYLYEKFIALDNFQRAARLLGKNKPKNRKAQWIKRHFEEYGAKIHEQVKRGYQFKEPRKTTIIDNYKGKQRNLKIPHLDDQIVHIAWLNIAVPIIERHNYFYNCGSIPGAGQQRAVKALKKWFRNPKLKYGATLDIRKFYETCPHEAVMQGLRRMIKDEAFLKVTQEIMDTMSDNGVGLAIGYPVSHWFANVALTHIDHELKRNFPEVKMARYMDDIALLSANKRKLRRCILWIKAEIEKKGMALKKWAYQTLENGLTFLSYRFYHGYVLMIKALMIRIARRFRRAKMNVHTARGLISYFGILKFCNSLNFRKTNVYPYANFNHLRKVVSNYDKGILLERAC